MIRLDGYMKGVNLGGWLSQGSLELSHIDSFNKEDDIKRIKEMGCDHFQGYYFCRPVPPDVFEKKFSAARQVGSFPGESDP